MNIRLLSLPLALAVLASCTVQVAVPPSAAPKASPTPTQRPTATPIAAPTAEATPAATPTPTAGPAATPTIAPTTAPPTPTPTPGLRYAAFTPKPSAKELLATLLWPMPDGSVWVGFTRDNRALPGGYDAIRYDATGQVVATASIPSSPLQGVVDAQGNLFVRADKGAEELLKIDPTGKVLATVDVPQGSAADPLADPAWSAADQASLKRLLPPPELAISYVPYAQDGATWWVTSLGAGQGARHVDASGAVLATSTVPAGWEVNAIAVTSTHEVWAGQSRATIATADPKAYPTGQLAFLDADAKTTGTLDAHGEVGAIVPRPAGGAWMVTWQGELADDAVTPKTSTLLTVDASHAVTDQLALPPEVYRALAPASDGALWTCVRGGDILRIATP